MIESKEWDWEAENNDIWFNPSEESFYYAEKWRREKRRRMLDLGCGLGRHTLLFAKYGFDVSACDLSDYAVNATAEAAEKNGLKVETRKCDMLNLTYEDDTFDCIYSYLVISHTDTEGFIKTLSEIKRVMKKGGEIFLTLCAKDTWSFAEANYPKVDDNTIIKDNDGPEKGIPHFYVDLDDVLRYFDKDFEIKQIRHINNCYYNFRIQNSRHFYVTAVRK